MLDGIRNRLAARQESSELRAAVIPFEREPVPPRRVSPEVRAYHGSLDEARERGELAPPTVTDPPGQQPIFSCFKHRWGEAKDGKPMRPVGSCPHCLADFLAARSSPTEMPDEIQPEMPERDYGGVVSARMENAWQRKREALEQEGVILPGSSAESSALVEIENLREEGDEHLATHPDFPRAAGPFRRRGQSKETRRRHRSASERYWNKRARAS